MSQEAENIQIATLASFSTTTSVGVATSLIVISPMTSVWLLLNQFRSLMLLMLTGAYLTNDIVKFITGMDFTLMSFQFLNSKEISILKPIIDYLHYKQKDESLNEIGIESSSTLINDLSLILAAILLFFIVLAIRLIKFLIFDRKKIKKNIAK